MKSSPRLRSFQCKIPRPRSLEGQMPHIFHNDYLSIIKCCDVFVKVKFSSRSNLSRSFHVKYLKLFMITNFVMTQCFEVYTILGSFQGQIPRSNMHNKMYALRIILFD